jgi:hypothetical protein
MKQRDNYKKAHDSPDSTSSPTNPTTTTAPTPVGLDPAAALRAPEHRPEALRAPALSAPLGLQEALRAPLGLTPPAPRCEFRVLTHNEYSAFTEEEKILVRDFIFKYVDEKEELKKSKPLYILCSDRGYPLPFLIADTESFCTIKVSLAELVPPILHPFSNVNETCVLRSPRSSGSVGGDEPDAGLAQTQTQDNSLQQFKEPEPIAAPPNSPTSSSSSDSSSSNSDRGTSSNSSGSSDSGDSDDDLRPPAKQVKLGPEVEAEFALVPASDKNKKEPEPTVTITLDDDEDEDFGRANNVSDFLTLVGEFTLVGIYLVYIILLVLTVSLTMSSNLNK